MVDPDSIEDIVDTDDDRIVPFLEPEEVDPRTPDERVTDYPDDEQEFDYVLF